MPPGTLTLRKCRWAANPTPGAIRAPGSRLTIQVGVTTMAVMGTQEAVATATHGGIHEMTLRGIHAMTDHSPEAVDHPMGVEETDRQMASAPIDADVDLHTMEDPQVEAQEAIPAEAAPPGLAPGTATSKDASGKNRTK